MTFQPRRHESMPFARVNHGEVSLRSTLAKSAFPPNCTYSGWVDIRTRPIKDWKRRYFVLSNNFLLSAATPHATELERVIPLEGTNIKSTTKTSELSFEVSSRRKRYYFRAGSPAECNKWTEYIERASTLKIKDVYRFIHTLGVSESQNTKVVAARHRVTGQESAIKIIDKRTCNQQMLGNEVQILKQLQHPCVVQLYDLFETKNYLYLVMERCEGGELFEQIAQLDGGHYSEAVCCSIIHQIAQGVKYMHTMGIVHRDLKPENILCIQPNSCDRVKLADFGISKIVENADSASMTTMCGTLSYTAPEILSRRSYHKKVDYWSIGVIMHILLCGYPPFYGETDAEVQRQILQQNLVLEPEDWAHVSEPGKALVLGLLDKDPTSRKTVDDILTHAWVESSRDLGAQNVNERAFHKARQSFRETVIKRRLRKQSMSAFETSSSAMNRIYRSHDDMTGPEAHRQQNGGMHDIGSPLTQDHRPQFTFQHSADHMFELELPGRIRGSFNQHNFNNIQQDDDDTSHFRGASQRSQPMSVEAIPEDQEEQY